MLAAILVSGDPERLYTALSLLVSTAAGDEPAWGLATFGALAPLLAGTPPAEPAAAVIDAEREPFARTLAELRETAATLGGVRLYACSAAVSATGADPALIAARLDGVMSTPRFLRETAGARLVAI